jgi:hypothetical protein
MFIRIKKIQGKDYAYHVENKRAHGKVKQKVKEYLGRVIMPSKSEDISFFEFIKSSPELYVQNKSYKEIIVDLTRWELTKHDLNDIAIDMNTYSVKKNNTPIVIKLNEGYLYSKTLSDLLNFQAVGDDEYFIGKEFAELFVKAGIDIPKEVFVKLFEKITRK